MIGAVRVASRTLACPEPLDVGLTFGPVMRGRNDPSSRLAGTDWMHAMHTPDGPVTFSLHADASRAVVNVKAWGPGCAWVVEHAAEIAGLRDASAGFAPAHPVVAALQRRLRGMRIIRLGAVYDLTLATTVEQRVTTIEARRSWRALVRRHGSPAPGDHDLVLPPSRQVVAELPDWEWREVGIEARRSATLRRIAVEAPALARATAAGDTVVERRLLGLRGIGPWTTAIVMHFAAGDADAVPVGDWHLPGHVGHALAGEPRADDARMLELLEPFRPHRGRVWRLLVSGTRPPPRRAPRARIHSLMRAEMQRGRR